jgi:predicted DCC family thiol-disulfide oxidoreductase YuxK
LAEKDASYNKSTAVLMISKQLPKVSGASIALRTPRFVRDKFYSAVSSKRMFLFGERKECRLGDEDHFKDRFISDDEVL